MTECAELAAQAIAEAEAGAKAAHEEHEQQLTGTADWGSRAVLLLPSLFTLLLLLLLLLWQQCQLWQQDD